MKIYTRTGDDGETGLFGGSRVPKSDARVAAYGGVDELNAAIGVALTQQPQDLERETLAQVQHDLFAIGAQLASPHPEKVVASLEKADISEDQVAVLERVIDRADGELPTLKAFVMPGGSAKAAHLHHARTVCRRAERQVVALSLDQDVPPIIVQYLNRLSDLLFVLARLANARAGVPDVEW